MSRALPKESRGAIILGAAILFRAAKMVGGTATNAEETMNAAEKLVAEAEQRGHVEFEK